MAWMRCLAVVISLVQGQFAAILRAGASAPIVRVVGQIQRGDHVRRVQEIGSGGA